MNANNYRFCCEYCDVNRGHGKLLEDRYLKKHKRTNFHDKYVIYIKNINEKRGIFKIGKTIIKTINLKYRMSSYNTGVEHKIVYYKECKNEEEMRTIEELIFFKLREFRETANRERFILPVEKDISFFTNTIDLCIALFDN
jgi:hypothetical protein